MKRSDAADARNQIRQIRNDNENEKSRRKRKNPARHTLVQNIANQTFPAFDQRLDHVLHAGWDFLDIFQVLKRTTIKMNAATIQVQTMEFVTGNPKTLNTSGAAAGTASSGPAAGTVAAATGIVKLGTAATVVFVSTDSACKLTAKSRLKSHRQ